MDESLKTKYITNIFVLYFPIYPHEYIGKPINMSQPSAQALPPTNPDEAKPHQSPNPLPHLEINRVL